MSAMARRIAESMLRLAICYELLAANKEKAPRLFEPPR
jgi:hypothetical protein